MTAVWPYFLTGSSPRVRGKLEHFACVDGQARIIPARAGQTPSRIFCDDKLPDHPRACGANVPCLTVVRRVIGSSPRVRGKHVRGIRAQGRLRIIPARAGQTHKPRLSYSPNADHPRACGANVCGGHFGCLGVGSSPRVRGKHRWARPWRCSSRIIPARAGQTKRPLATSLTQTDHPRACGANDHGC